MGNTRYSLILAMLLTVLISCGGKPPPEIPERKVLDPSPTKVVEELLKSWQKEDFKRAFKYVYAPYSDEDGYVIQMKNYFKDNQITILDFQVLGTQIYDRTSIVIVEIKQRVKSLKTGSVIDLTQRSQYDLGIFDDEWKVTSGICIANCIEQEQPLKGTESNK
ncbi:MAG TPA: hypothetical protein VFJ67_00695 [Thermodesulfobacteriota bacterium]|nr:hypothetical protein [Thermodesulfobacteriota bacterium]